jgi:hypothetical protein
MKTFKKMKKKEGLRRVYLYIIKMHSFFLLNFISLSLKYTLFFSIIIMIQVNFFIILDNFILKNKFSYSIFINLMFT